MISEIGEKIPAVRALELLKEGNAEFVKEHFHVSATEKEIRLLDTEGQHPYATVITCSDSRVPPEMIFNCGLGEIFVIRTAGNVLGDFEIGSAEYAADHLHTHLIVVMGHSHCGAVAGTVEAHSCEGCLGRIMQEISPSVKEAKKQEQDTGKMIALAEDLNIRRGVEILKKDAVLAACDHLMIMGAKYNTNSGEVTFFE